MIDNETKQKLLQELEKTGIVYSACLKAGVDKSTYYRWIQKDSKFKIQSKRAIKYGRSNLVDIAEHALMVNVKDRKMDAIKYVLSHNSARYKRSQQSKVVMEHIVSKPAPESNKSPGTLAELLRAEFEESLRKQKQQLESDAKEATELSDSP